MSGPQDRDSEAQYEYDALSQQASTLATNLARKRADIALMRAEAATVAVSLESAREQLDTLLRNEAVIRSAAPQSPQDAENQADFFPDHGLVRALKGQLEVTRESLKDAMKTRDDLRAELRELGEDIDLPKQACDEAGIAAFTADTVPTPNMSTTRASDRGFEERRDMAAEGNTSLDGLDLGPQAHGDHRPQRNSFTNSIIQALKDGIESNSSFRFDHARIWRDVTMPNLALVKTDSPSSKSLDVSLGVVTERIFEGVTCFTPTKGAGATPTPNDMRIESCGDIREPEPHIAAAVAPFYSTLVAKTKEDGEEMRVLAPTVALERVMDLIKDKNGDPVSEQQPSQPENSHHDAQRKPLKSEDTSQPEDSRHDAVQNSLKREDNVEKNESCVEPSSAISKSPTIEKPKHPLVGKIAPRMSDRSEVLTEEHFAHIISGGVPARFQESALDLLYSTDLHGFSLHTLYHRASKASPTLVAIRDTKGRVFGCYGAQPWKPSATRYYGTGESFVFGTDGSDLAKVYKWSRKNSFFQFTSNTFLAIGGGAGSHFALWVDEDLLMGTTFACSTFDNPSLTDIYSEGAVSNAEFKILSLEVWTFAAHRKH